MKNNLFKYHKKKLIIPIILILIGIYIRNFMIIFIGSLICILLTFFYRKPDIIIRKYNRHIISPGYGRILNLVHNGKFIIVTINTTFLSPTPQYIPYNGFLQFQKHISGTHNPTSNLVKSANNERVISNMITKIGNITMVQYSGMFDQNIGTFLVPRRKVYQGQELGYSSRIDIVLPYHPKIFPQVRQGDYVYAGSTLFSW